MKKKNTATSMSETHSNEEEETNILPPNTDLCEALTSRYAKSRAPQHRHLIATAAAMRSILLDESLPLSPPAYFAAAISSFQASSGDADSIAALSALISIVLSDETMELPAGKARDAAAVVAEFLERGEVGLATGMVRSLVKSLGALALKVDLEDWAAVEPPLRVLLNFSVDKRPKVRRCAQECLEKVFKAFKVSHVKKSASKVVLSMYQKYIPMAKGLDSTEQSDESKTSLNLEQMEMVHMLYVVKVIVPYLSNKVIMKILCDAAKHLGCRFSSLTQQIIDLMERLLENAKVELLVPESDNVLSALQLYISSDDNNHVEAVLSASTLLKNCMKRLQDVKPSLWTRFLPSIFKAVTGFLNSDANTSERTENILKELINAHISQNHFLHTKKPMSNSKNEETPEAIAVTSICSELSRLLGACDVPSECLTKVVSILFLKLGEISCFFMKEILLKLSEKAMNSNEESPNFKHLEACIGSAVIAMGPQNVLCLIPISLLPNKLSCSNLWLIPVLKKYIIGASLQYFIEHIAPLAESVKNASMKVKKASLLKGLQSCFHGLWDLLPAFCRYPTDTKNFQALSKLLIVTLKEEPSLYETIGKALQELVNGNRNIIRTIDDSECRVNLPVNFIYNNFTMERGTMHARYSKETASTNMKALADSSMDLFQIFTDTFLISPPEKRTLLKGAIGCLASVINTESIKNIFLSLVAKCEDVDDLADSRKLNDESQEGIIQEGKEQVNSKEESQKKRCLVMELAASVVEAADKDLINIFFDFIKSSVLANDEGCQDEVHYILSRILEEHSWFLSGGFDDVMELVFRITIPVDRVMLEYRFSCLHSLLVHIIKSNDADLDTKAFQILNEIIMTLKTKKESRKVAYDILLKISCSLKNSPSTDTESNLERLLNMVMGYLSSSSPHIISGAISALSLLIYNDARFCIAVPNLISSVLALLENKDTELIKAALGFIKVLVSSLDSHDLVKLLPDIINGILPWSSVSKFHFRSKVGVIFEMLIRKFGSGAVGILVPKKYKNFVNNVKEGRESKKHSEGPSNSEDLSNRGKKRAFEDVVGEKEMHPKSSRNNFQKGKRMKQDNHTSKFSNSNATESKVPFKPGSKGGDKKRNRESDQKQVGENKNINGKRKKVSSEMNESGEKRKKNGKMKNDASEKNVDHGSVVSKPGRRKLKLAKQAQK